MFSAFFELIQNEESICIFRHINPDMDALGAQFGLKYWLNENFPDKKVYCLGQGSSNVEFEPFDVIDDEVIINSIAIVLDSSASDRVDDSRFSLAKKVLVIDHHPKGDDFMDIDIRNTKMAATCEYLAQMFLESEYCLSLKVATTLYYGILTDSASFTTNNTTANTLYIASKLTELGINIPKCNMDVFEINFKTFQFASMVRSRIEVIEGGLAYCILMKEDFESFGLSASHAREHIIQYQKIKEINTWCLFTEEENGLFNGSIRSKTHVINDIASQFNGGGHAYAAGVKNLSLENVKKCLNILQNQLLND